MQLPLVREPLEQRADEVADRGRPVVRDVLDPEPAAEVDDLRHPAELRAQVGREGGEPVDAHARRQRVAQVRAEVQVERRPRRARVARARIASRASSGGRPNFEP